MLEGSRFDFSILTSTLLPLPALSGRGIGRSLGTCGRKTLSLNDWESKCLTDCILQASWENCTFFVRPLLFLVDHGSLTNCLIMEDPDALFCCPLQGTKQEQLSYEEREVLRSCMKHSKLILSFTFFSIVSRHLSKVFAQMVKAVFAISSSSKEVLHLGPLSGVVHGQGLKSIKPPVHPKVAPSKVLTMASRSSISEEEKTTPVLLKFSKDFIPSTSVMAQVRLQYSFNTIISPTSDPRIRKQL